MKPRSRAIDFHEVRGADATIAAMPVPVAHACAGSSWARATRWTRAPVSRRLAVRGPRGVIRRQRAQVIFLLISTGAAEIVLFALALVMLLAMEAHKRLRRLSPGRGAS